MALYTPPSPAASRVVRFLQRINAAESLSLASYEDLYHWSTEHIDRFWSQVWDDTGVLGHKGAHVVDPAARPPDNPAWFAQARLNWAENMLRVRSPEKTALVQASTFSHPHPQPRLRTFVCVRLRGAPALQRHRG